jgi:hypothetical protein
MTGNEELIERFYAASVRHTARAGLERFMAQNG